MALKDITKKMHALLFSMKKDLDKAEKGNKAAAQRVRTGSIKYEKIAKVFRKESVKEFRKKKVAKKPSKKTKKVVKKKKPCKPCKKKPCKKTVRRKKKR